MILTPIDFVSLIHHFILIAIGTQLLTSNQLVTVDLSIV
jgi:hypothetical protein